MKTGILFLLLTLTLAAAIIAPLIVFTTIHSNVIIELPTENQMNLLMEGYPEGHIDFVQIQGSYELDGKTYYVLEISRRATFSENALKVYLSNSGATIVSVVKKSR